MPLAPDLQIQVLHIVQEALSNVRKHAPGRACLARRPAAAAVANRSTRRRARLFDTRRCLGRIPYRPAHHASSGPQRLGARLEVLSTPGLGTSVVLTLPLTARSPVADQPAQRQAA
jgi:two-component system nitrate/nitrite sensor histidine kinase NarX